MALPPSQPGPITLSVSIVTPLAIVPRRDRRVELAWPADALHHVLESSDSPAPDGVWSIETTPTKVEDERRTAVVEATAPVRFFRLHFQPAPSP